jgi:uncharacterized protein Ymh
VSGWGQGIDAARAAQNVEEFLGLLRRNRAAFVLKDEIYASNVTWRQTQNEILARRPLVLALAEELDHDVAERMRQRSSVPWEWEDAEEAAAELLGLIRDYGELRAPMTGTSAPAAGLHPGLWRSVETSWNEARFRDAVREGGFFVLGAHLPGKLGRLDLAGQALVSEAFSTEPPVGGRPRLRFPGLAPDTAAWQRALAAAEHLGLGCALAVQDVVDRRAEPIGETRALDVLTALSVFARWVDEAEALL